MDRSWLLGGLLVAGGVGLAAAATKRPKIRADSRVFLFGDSLAVGLSAQLRQLANEDQIAFLGRGIVGSRIDQWANDPSLVRDLDAFGPTLILVSLGTNDAALGAGAVERQAPALEKLLLILDEAGAEVIWIGPPSLPFPSEPFTDMLRGSVRYYFPSEALDIPRGPDDLHPTAAGYAGWAGRLWQWLT